MRVSIRAAFLFLLVALAFAGEPPAIKGKVVDSTGALIPGAHVLVNPGKIETYSDEEGNFAVCRLEPGQQYSVTASLEGFVPWERFGLVLRPGETITVEAQLGVASIPSGPPIECAKATEDDLRNFDKILKVFDEPCFCSKAAIERAPESYRFLWMRTFDRPVLIALLRKGPTDAKLIHKETDGQGGYEMGSLAEIYFVDVGKRLGEHGESQEMVKGALDYIYEDAKGHVWSQPFKVVHPGLIVLDGAGWTIEAIKDGKCHVVTRHSPEPRDPVRWFVESQLMAWSSKRFYYFEVY